MDMLYNIIIMPLVYLLQIITHALYPDIVIPQKSLNHSQKVKNLNFDVFVVGDDWVGKYDYLREEGVDVVYFPYGDGISSSKLKKQIVEKYKKLQDRANNHFSIDTEIKY